jgi:hypothetical protein
MPYFINVVEITPLTAGSWQTVDISSYIPEGVVASGVMLRWSASTAGNYTTGWRKKGSTDNRVQVLGAGTQVGAFIGCNTSNQFEYYVGDNRQRLFLVGYFGDEAVFFTNGLNKTPGSSNAWTDVNISDDTGDDVAIAAIFEFVPTSSDSTYSRASFRPNGASFDYFDYFSCNHGGFITGLDANEICELKVYSTTYTKIYLVGYLKDGVVMNTSPTDKSLASSGSYIDLAALPVGATGGFIYVKPSSYGFYFALRTNGSTFDLYAKCDRATFIPVGCDENRLIEGKISTTSVDFFLYGHTFSTSEDVKRILAQFI